MTRAEGAVGVVADRRTSWSISTRSSVRGLPARAASVRSATQAGSRSKVFSEPVGHAPRLRSVSAPASPQLPFAACSRRTRATRTQPATTPRPSTTSPATDRARRAVVTSRTDVGLRRMQCPNCGHDNTQTTPVLRALRHRRERRAAEPPPPTRPWRRRPPTAAAPRRRRPNPWGSAAARAAARGGAPPRRRRTPPPPPRRRPPPNPYAPPGAVRAAAGSVRTPARRARRLPAARRTLRARPATASTRRRIRYPGYYGPPTNGLADRVPDPRASSAGCSAGSDRSLAIVFGFVAQSQIKASAGPPDAATAWPKPGSSSASSGLALIILWIVLSLAIAATAAAT